MRLRSRHQQVEVRPLQGLFNHQCHQNCVEWVRTHPEHRLTVVETVYVDEDGDPVLHYVVRDAAGVHHDVTLGWRAQGLEVYRIRDLLPEDHARILREFDNSMASWLEEFVPRWQRALLNITRIV
jgi:hypothetical protein